VSTTSQRAPSGNPSSAPRRRSVSCCCSRHKARPSLAAPANSKLSCWTDRLGFCVIFCDLVSFAMEDLPVDGVLT
jgi:hypothetical protein